MRGQPGAIGSRIPTSPDSDVSEQIRELWGAIGQLRTAIPFGVVSAASVGPTDVYDPSDATPNRTLLSVDVEKPDGYSTALCFATASIWGVIRDATTTGDNRLSLGASINGFTNTVQQDFPEPNLHASHTASFALNLTDLPDGDPVTIGAIGSGSTGWDPTHGQITVVAIVLFIR